MGIAASRKMLQWVFMYGRRYHFMALHLHNPISTKGLFITINWLCSASTVTS